MLLKGTMQYSIPLVITLLYEPISSKRYKLVRDFPTYPSEVGTGGLLNLGKKAFKPSKLGKIDTGPPF